MEAFHSFFQDKGTHPLGAKGRICQSVDDGIIGQGAIGIENLRTIEDIVITVFCSHCLLTGCIGAGGMFRQAKRADSLPRSNRAEEALFLFICRIGIHDATAIKRRIDRKGNAKGSIDFRYFFNGQDIRQIADIGTAESLGITKTKHPHLPKFLKSLQGKFRRFIPFYHTRGQSLGSKIADLIHNLLLLCCQFKIHTTSLL